MREAEITLLGVRGSLRYSLSSRDREEMMRQRGLSIAHRTSSRWVPHDAPEIDKRCRPHLKAPHASWKVDETSIPVRPTWM